MHALPLPEIPAAAFARVDAEMARGVFHDDLVLRAYDAVGNNQAAAARFYRQVRAHELAWGIAPDERAKADAATASVGSERGR